MQFHKRRQLVVNKTMQWAAVAYVTIIIMVILAFHTWLTFSRLDSILKINRDQIPLQHLLLQDFFITLAVMAVFIVFMSIFGSHKVAGPIFRCEKAIKLIQQGDLTDMIKLRRGDLLVPFSEEINLALANLREFVSEDRAHVQEAVRLILLARSATPVPEAQTSLERAIATLSRVGSKLKIENELLRAGQVEVPLPITAQGAQYLGSMGANKTMTLMPPSIARPAARPSQG